MSIIQPQVDCSSAKEFLDALSPLGAYFGNSQPSESWLFRGQGQDLPLIPSAFRADDRLSNLMRRKLMDYKERLIAQRDILIRFFEIADKRGLVLPDDSQQLRSNLETLMADRGNEFIGRLSFEEWQPDKMALSLTALAQHYGIPTRLLDWTRQAYIAAFFAANAAVRYGYNSGYLVVWAFFFPALGKHDVLDKQNDPILVVTAPSATNPNLKAQQGVFTWLNPHYTKEAEGIYLPMEQVLEGIANKPEAERYHNNIFKSKLRKFTLPVTESGLLLYLLAKLDITYSLIYPGYQSIISDIDTEYSW